MATPPAFTQAPTKPYVVRSVQLDVGLVNEYGCDLRRLDGIVRARVRIRVKIGNSFRKQTIRRSLSDIICDSSSDVPICLNSVNFFLLFDVGCFVFFELSFIQFVVNFLKTLQSVCSLTAVSYFVVQVLI